MRQSLMATALAVASVASVKAQMQFSLSSDKQVYRAGEPVHLTWKLHNGTDRDWVVYKASLGLRQSFPQITFTVEGPSGRQVISLTADEKASTFEACKLQRGQTLQTPFNFTDWMTYLDHPLPPGQYGISAVFAHPAGEMRPLLQDSMVSPCGSGQPMSKALSSEIWDGTLTAPQISIRVE
jgi:hypothetical protein